MKTLQLILTVCVAIGFSSVAGMHTAFPRVHANSIKFSGLGLNSGTNPYKPAENVNQMPEEEKELENLKSSTKNNIDNDLHKEFPFDTTNAADKRNSAPATSATDKEKKNTVSALNTKLPVNEETPAVSDNANSEKLRFSLPQGTFGFIAPSKFDDKRKQGQEIGGISSLLMENSQPRFNAYDSVLNNNGLNGLDTEYTPQDIAEYIFWTGDEKDVIQALNEFIQGGLVSRDDAISFWGDVKGELSQLKNRYSVQAQQQVNQDANTVDLFDKWGDNKAKIRRGSSNGVFHDISAIKKQMDVEYGPEGMGIYDLRAREGNTVQFQRNPIHEKPQTFATSTLAVSGEDLDYEDLVDKIRQADAKLREYSLEGVIYQLAKELFSQGLQEQPQLSIQRFARFIEVETAEGRIPKDLAKAVLDTLVGALMDAISERGNGRTDAQINPPPKPTQPHPQKLLKA